MENKKYLVLVVDRDLMLTGLISAILAKHGMDCVQANSPIMAMEEFEKRVGEIDLILVSVNNVKGPELVEKMASTDLPLPEIVFMTGGLGRYGPDKEHLVAISNGPILMKPFNEKDLIDRIELVKLNHKAELLGGVAALQARLR